MEDGGKGSDHEPARQARTCGHINLTYTNLKTRLIPFFGCEYNLQVFAPAGKVLPSWLQSTTSWTPWSSADDKVFNQSIMRWRLEMTEKWISQKVKRKETHNSTIHSPLSSCLHPSSWITVNSAVADATRLLANSTSNLILTNRCVSIRQLPSPFVQADAPIG